MVDPNQQIGLSITQRVVGRAAALLVTLETNLGQEIAEIIPPNISKYIYIFGYIWWDDLCDFLAEICFKRDEKRCCTAHNSLCDAQSYLLVGVHH